MAEAEQKQPEQQNQVFAKCAWRLIPFMMLLYVTNYLDRVNVGFAALTMNHDLGFSASVYGFAAGIFFLSYALFQIPGTVLLERMGARRTVFAIMAIWGALSAATAFVHEPIAFYALRFLLGVAESGFFPGIILYLTFWFPRDYRARFTAIFMLAIPLSSSLGGPLSGLILGLDGAGGFRGWQWLFLIEGLPACFLAFAVLKFLPDGPAAASFLSESEKAVIAARLAGERAPAPPNLWAGLIDPRVLLLGLAGTGIGAGIFGGQLWLPQIIKAMGYSNLITGCISALPYVAAIPTMLLVGRSSDKRGERVWHTAIPLLVAACGLCIAALADSHTVAVAGLVVTMAGLMGTYGPYYTQSSSFLSGPSAPSSIALVNLMCTGLGGFIGPNVLGVLKDRTGGYQAGMFTLAGGLICSIMILIVLARVMAAHRALSHLPDNKPA
ncbi:MAG TPA: MFS transporter [Rhizomicrobium sp.]|nr:MFS transporter [Rhizomicrobium sp.]